MLHKCSLKLKNDIHPFLKLRKIKMKINREKVNKVVVLFLSSLRQGWCSELRTAPFWSCGWSREKTAPSPDPWFSVSSQKITRKLPGSSVDSVCSVCDGFCVSRNPHGREERPGSVGASAACWLESGGSGRV